MDALLWLFLPIIVAGGSALLSYYIMQSRLEVAVSKEREVLAEARATIQSQKVTLEERIKATQEAAKRQAMDDVMQDLRIEERSYVRESKSLNALRKTMVLQERLYFRNIPLSNWIEHEMIVEEGRDLQSLPKESVFAPASLPAMPERVAVAKLLDDAVPKTVPQETVILTNHATAFGAQ